MSTMETVYGPIGGRAPTGTPGPDAGAAVTGERSTRLVDNDAGAGDPVLVLVVMVAIAAALGWVSIRVQVGR